MHANVCPTARVAWANGLGLLKKRCPPLVAIRHAPIWFSKAEDENGAQVIPGSAWSNFGRHVDADVFAKNKFGLFEGNC